MANDKAIRTDRQLKIAAQFGFVVIGIITVLLGLILPIISQRLSINDAEAGMLFLAQFSGSIVGTLFSGRLIRQFGFAEALLIGFALLIIGVPGLNVPSFAVCWIAIFVYGLGLGVAIPATNLLAIELTPSAGRTSAANFINFCWGVGAIACQPFVSVFVSGGSLLLAVTIIDVMLAAVAVTVFTAERRNFLLPEAADSADPAATAIWGHPLAWMLAAFNFLNIGIETGLGGWLTTYSDRLQEEGRMWFNATILFFTFLVLGRGLASIASRFLSENRLLLVCCVMLLVGVVLILMTGSPIMPLAGAMIAGAGTSAIFPTNMVRFARIFGPAATRKATPLFISGTMGAAILTSLVGYISTLSGRLETGLIVLCSAAALMTILQIFIPFAHRGLASRRAGQPLRP